MQISVYLYFEPYYSPLFEVCGVASNTNLTPSTALAIISCAASRAGKT